MKKVATRHLLGAPLSRAEREDIAEGLVAFFGGQPRAVIEYFVKSADRIMTKAIGLMTADSIFAALALFLSERPHLGFLSVIALVMLILAVVLCCSTLLATSQALGRDSLNDAAILRHGLNLTMDRTIRFTLALYLTGVSVLLILAQVLSTLVWGK